MFTTCWPSKPPGKKESQGPCLPPSLFPLPFPGEDLPRSGKRHLSSPNTSVWLGLPGESLTPILRPGLPASRCCAGLRLGHACKPLKLAWRREHAGHPGRRLGPWAARCGQSDAPDLQLYPGSSGGPNEFHRVSGCSVAEGRTARRSLGDWVSQRGGGRPLGPDQGTQSQYFGSHPEPTSNSAISHPPCSRVGHTALLSSHPKPRILNLGLLG